MDDDYDSDDSHNSENEDYPNNYSSDSDNSEISIISEDTSISILSSTSSTQSESSGYNMDIDQEISDSDESINNDSEESLDTTDSEENAVGNYQHFYRYDPIAGRMNENVQLKNHWRPRDFFFTFLSKSVLCKETYTSVLQNMKLVNTAYRDPTLPTNKEQLWKMLNRNRTNITYRTYCCVCKTKLGMGKKATRNCHCGQCGPEMQKQPLAVFIHVSIRAQLIELLERPNMETSLDYRNTRIKWNENSMEDIYDGEMYQTLQQDFLADRNNYSFTLWLDGVQVAKSSSANAVPILLEINELSPHARKRHMILAGVWTGTGKPVMNHILKPIVRELASLQNEGITWTPHEGGIQRVSRFITCILSCDSDARWDVLNMRRFNGYYGCTFCFVPGARQGRNHYYPANINAPVRTHNDIFDDMNCASETGEVINGVKNMSALAALPNFNLSSGVVVDSFHNLYEGVSKNLIEILLTDVGQPWYIGDVAVKNIINSRIRAVKFPTRFSRQTRSLDCEPHWKGTEFRNFILIAPVILHGILPPNIHTLVVKLSEAAFLLNQCSISPVELDRAEALLEDFVVGFECFGQTKMVYNIHLLRHLSTSVRNWGPLWVHSGYQFEAWNKKLIDGVKSANDRGSQIVDRFLLAKCLEDAMFNEILAPEARSLMREHLRGACWDVPPLVCTGRSFVGLKRKENPDLDYDEILVNVGFQIAEITSYDSAQIHGAVYKVRDEKQRQYCNFLVHARTGFYTCEGIVSFNNIDDEVVEGIIGSRLRTYDPIFQTTYIRTYQPEGGQLIFISYLDVISPAISILWNDSAVIIPVPNCWESD